MIGSSCARIVVSGFFCASFIATPVTAAEHPEARFVFVRESGAELCPGSDQMQAAIAERLGYVPFRADAAHTIVATLRRHATRFEAVVQSLRADGGVQGVRELSSDSNTCTELASAVAATVAILIDADAPVSSDSPAKPVRAPDPVSTSMEPTVAAPLPAELAPSRSSGASGATRASGALGLGFGMSTGLAPGVALHPGLFALFEIGSLRAVLTLDRQLASERRGERAGVRTTAFFTRLSPCYVPLRTRVRVGACVVGLAGLVEAEGFGDLSIVERKRTLAISAGPAVDAVWSFGDHWMIMARLEALFAVVRSTYRVESVDLFRAPAVAGSGTLSIGYQFQ
jgi:hypothetical protein